MEYFDKEILWENSCLKILINNVCFFGVQVTKILIFKQQLIISQKMQKKTINISLFCICKIFIFNIFLYIIFIKVLSQSPPHLLPCLKWCQPWSNRKHFELPRFQLQILSKSIYSLALAFQANKKESLLSRCLPQIIYHLIAFQILVLMFSWGFIVMIIRIQSSTENHSFVYLVMAEQIPSRIYL